MGDKRSPQLTNSLESPTDTEIIEQLTLLPGGEQVSAIELHISKTHHIAVAGSEKEGFHALYHEFSSAGEWETIRDDLPTELAAQLLINYRDRTEDWKRLVEWRRLSVTDALEQQREQEDAQKLVLWITKAVGFAIGVLNVGSKPSRKRRPK